MRARVSNPALLRDLISYLQKAECIAEQVGQDELELSIPRAPDEAQARREAQLYLRTWRAMNPGANVEIID